MTYFQPYGQAQLHAWSGVVNWTQDTIVATLHTSGYTPSLATDAWVSALTSEVPAGLGYSTGGVPLTGKSANFTPAGSWSDVWAPLTVYPQGAIVSPAPANGLIYRCVTAGTSGAAPPAWAAEGQAVTDGSATWTAVGPGAVCLLASQIQWTSMSASFRYIVLSDRTPGSASQQPLLAVADMGSMVTGAGGNFTVPFDQQGALVLWSP